MVKQGNISFLTETQRYGGKRIKMQIELPLRGASKSGIRKTYSQSPEKPTLAISGGLTPWKYNDDRLC